MTRLRIRTRDLIAEHERTRSVGVYRDNAIIVVAAVLSVVGDPTDMIETQGHIRLIVINQGRRRRRLRLQLRTDSPKVQLQRRDVDLEVNGTQSDAPILSERVVSIAFQAIDGGDVSFFFSCDAFPRISESLTVSAFIKRFSVPHSASGDLTLNQDSLGEEILLETSCTAPAISTPGVHESSREVWPDTYRTDVEDLDGVRIQLVHGGDYSRRVFNVVFVHGLMGGSHTTWCGRAKTGESFFWPAALASDFDQLGVYTCGYHTGIFDTGGGPPDLRIVASTLTDEIYRLRISDKPIVFITHSMGGILVKNMIVNSVVQSLPSLVKRRFTARACAFIAVPHYGSDVAELARWLVPFRSAQVSNLTDECGLFELHRQFRGVGASEGIQFRYWCEGHAMGCRIGGGHLPKFLVGVRVVHPKSAAPDGDIDRSEIAADHESICKPASSADAMYVQAADWVRGLLARETGDANNPL
jgi:hypothetical protein